MSDFQEYWSAYQLAQAGLSPYDANLMQFFQAKNLQTPMPIMMWNPPWLLLLLAPLLMWPYIISELLWLGFSLLCLILSGLYWIKTLVDPNHKYNFSNSKIILTCLIFAPAWYCLMMGQVSLILLGGLTLFCFAHKKGWLGYSFLGLALMSLKPHLFVFFIIALFIPVLKKAPQQILLLSLLFLGLILATELAFNGINQQWLEAITANSRSNQEVPIVKEWCGTSFFGTLRCYIFTQGINGYHYTMLIWLALLFSWTSFHIFRTPHYSQPAQPILLALSVYFANFGWFFDQSLLLPLYLLIVAHASANNKILLLISLLVLQLSSILYLLSIANFQHEIFWYSPILFLIAYYILKKPISKQRDQKVRI